MTSHIIKSIPLLYLWLSSSRYLCCIIIRVDMTIIKSIPLLYLWLSSSRYLCCITAVDICLMIVIKYLWGIDLISFILSIQLMYRLSSSRYLCWFMMIIVDMTIDIKSIPLLYLWLIIKSIPLLYLWLSSSIDLMISSLLYLWLSSSRYLCCIIWLSSSRYLDIDWWLINQVEVLCCIYDYHQVDTSAVFMTSS